MAEPSNEDRHAHWWSPGGNTISSESGAAPYRRLALQLQHELSAAQSPRSVLIATPNRSALPAHASPCLAYCLAQELDLRVLLVDASGQDHTLSRIFGCEQRLGYSDLLSQSGQILASCVLPTSHKSVQFLPSGTVPTASMGRHQGAIPGLLAQALQSHDFVVMSGGSVLHDTAALAVTPYVGTVLLMPVENETLVADLDVAQKAVRFCRAQHIGVVMISGRSPQD
jgi:Mrp family chromosome partitioning ATPase